MAKLAIVARFESKISPDHSTGCLLWTGSRNSRGYGVFKVPTGRRGGRNIKAYRFAWELAKGPIPEGEGYHGACVLHRCDNPACVNVAHLFLGTNADNVADKTAKNRQTKGAQNKQAKLNEDDVRQIRRLRKNLGWTLRLIAGAMGVDNSTISDVLTGESWSHVSDEVAK